MSRSASLAHEVPDRSWREPGALRAVTKAQRSVVELRAAVPNASFDLAFVPGYTGR